MDCLLIDKLNEYTDYKYEFSLKSAVLERSADFCVIEIYYNDGVILDSAKKKEIEGIMLGITPQNFKYQVKFVKKFVNEESLKEELEKYIKTNYPSVTFLIESIKQENLVFDIKLIIDGLSYEHVTKVNLKDKIVKYFKSRYKEYEYKVEMRESNILVEDKEKLLKESYVEEEVDLLAPRKIEVFNKEVYIGEEIEAPASYIKDKEKLGEFAVFCGKIKGLKKYVYEYKVKEKEAETEESDSNFEKPETDKDEADARQQENTEKEAKTRERTVFRWNLTGFTDSISCCYNATKMTKAKMEVLEDGTSVIVRGKLVVSKFSGELQLFVKDISTCTLPENFEEVIIYRSEKPFYEWVKPEKYVSYKQDNLMNFFEEKVVPPHLKDKIFVCYDLETTGVHFESGDRIIEIGAVKIENGKITESFSTLVNPERSIPVEASKVNHIYDKDVKDAIKADQALQDFYKFTRGAILIGYNNINFDNVFLIGQGKNCRWNFDNETEDVFPLAQKFVFGVKNYRLITIAEKLGIVLDNAHRALFDTVATAEVFIKLAEKLEK